MGAQQTNYQSITPPHFPLNRFSTSSRFILFFLLSMFWINNSFAVLTISSDTDWDNSGTKNPPTGLGGYQEGIVINAGKTLTITNRNGLAKLVFNSGVDITLGVGAHLIIDNSTLTTSGTNTWVGIIAVGNSSLEQFTTFPDKSSPYTTAKWSGVLNSSQTQVILTNNTVIKNTEIGIASTLGAIVRTRDSEFNNCQKGITIDSYSSSLQPKINACYMMGTNFLWNTVLSGFNSSNFVGISLTGVSSVNIGGCQFRNDDTNPYCALERGTGILASESEFGVSTEGNRLRDPGNGCIENCMESSPPGTPTTGASCQFTNLKTAIKSAGNTSTSNERLGIRDSYFDNNLTCIDITYSQHNVIYKCDFAAVRSNLNGLYVDHGTNASCPYTSNKLIEFITTNYAKQVRVVENEFNFDASQCNYIAINRSGTLKSLIKKNNILNSNSGLGTGDNVRGIVCYYENPNLWIECNTFQNLTTDLYIYDFATTLRDQNQYDNDIHHNSNIFDDYSGKSGCFNLINNGTFNALVLPSTYTWFKTNGGSYPSITFRTDGISCSSDNCNELIEGKVKKISSETISLYPNPSHNIIYLTLKEGLETNATAILFNSVGQQLDLVKLQSKQIDISQVPDGIIYIRIKNGENIYNQKFTKISKLK